RPTAGWAIGRKGLHLRSGGLPRRYGFRWPKSDSGQIQLGRHEALEKIEVCPGFAGEELGGGRQLVARLAIRAGPVAPAHKPERPNQNQRNKTNGVPGTQRWMRVRSRSSGLRDRKSVV